MPLRKVAFLGLLLGFELESLIVPHYQIRTELRDLLHLPVYHVLLTFLVLVGLSVCLRREKISYRPIWSPGALLVHLVFFAALFVKVPALWGLTKNFPSVILLGIWSALGMSFLLSWLRIWTPIPDFLVMVKTHYKSLLLALVLSLAATYLSIFTTSWWFVFAGATFAVTEVFLLLLFSDPVVQPDHFLLGTSRFVVKIKAGCSGYEGMGLIAVLVGTYLWMRRDEFPFPRSFWLVPIAMAATWFANVLRLVVLVAIGSMVSPDIAMRGFHSQAGWLAFTMVGLTIIGLCERWRRTLAPTTDAPANEPSNQALPYAVPIMVMMLATMVSRAMTSEFDYFYFLRPLLTGLTLTAFWSKYDWFRQKPHLSSMVAGIMVYIFWVGQSTPTATDGPFEMLGLTLGSLWVVARLMGAVIIVPVVEELAFRGFLMRRLQSIHFWEVPYERLHLPALVLSSLAFGALHSELWAGFLAGLCYGWLATRKGGLVNAIMAHAITNLCIGIQAVYCGDWWLWQ